MCRLALSISILTASVSGHPLAVLIVLLLNVNSVCFCSTAGDDNFTDNDERDSCTR